MRGERWRESVDRKAAINCFRFIFWPVGFKQTFPFPSIVLFRSISTHTQRVSERDGTIVFLFCYFWCRFYSFCFVFLLPHTTTGHLSYCFPSNAKFWQNRYSPFSVPFSLSSDVYFCGCVFLCSLWLNFRCLCTVYGIPICMFHAICYNIHVIENYWKIRRKSTHTP